MARLEGRAGRVSADAPVLTATEADVPAPAQDAGAPVDPAATPDAPVLYGGPRLQPAHFEPAHVPSEVARYGTAAHTLPVGSPGKVGILELEFALRGVGEARRTELVRHFQKSPLQIMQPLYYNVARPDMPYTYLMTAGGGILHNDRQRIDLVFGPGTSAHVTTQAHTKVYRMEAGYATSLVNLEVGEGAYVEYLPDPLIPYIDARFYQRTAATVHPDATLIVGETIYAGRLSRGERHAYAVLASDLEVTRPGPAGIPVALDRVRLVPRDGQVGGPAVLGARDVVTSLYVVTSRVPAREVANALHDTVTRALADSADESARAGVSILPHDAGAWLRFVGDDTVTSAVVASSAAAAMHELITGLPAPAIRK
ncbi:urease accessory protein UreD [Microbacterium sp. HD4P20]|uniref:urease accessory protein UreD n=1 Tax=Microbacterium sp. HD4P20 TaxID=2864874 RepID=UPI001C63E787|nr:urease accessory protein UreD [Microbacterium sp. HD4P20]MCP2635495.1 urease accessory protein UreD [Microbacterium sp. HD4P20]